LSDVIASGLELLCQPLRGFHGLPGIVIGCICRPVQKIEDRLPRFIGSSTLLESSLMRKTVTRWRIIGKGKRGDRNAAR
jgi:hypothetical protein